MLCIPPLSAAGAMDVILPHAFAPGHEAQCEATPSQHRAHNMAGRVSKPRRLTMLEGAREVEAFRLSDRDTSSPS